MANQTASREPLKHAGNVRLLERSVEAERRGYAQAEAAKFYGEMIVRTVFHNGVAQKTSEIFYASFDR
jgi:hypothetical protein